MLAVWCNFIKKETLTQVFSCEFCEISKSTFFTQHLRTIASFIVNLSYVLMLPYFLHDRMESLTKLVEVYIKHLSRLQI